MSIINKTHIIQSLQQLGVQPGTHLMVHSSLRSFGHVAGGAPTIIAALMEVLTPAGTLMMPSFNHDIPFRRNGPGYYAPTETPTSNGKIPDTFWRMPDVLRSLNPTHPCAAWGKHAQRYTQYHHRTLTMGPDSPLGLLLKDDGYALLLGVDYGVNTFHHVVEMSIGAPCLGRRTEAYPIYLPDGRQVIGRTWGWRNGACPFSDRGRYTDEMCAVHHQTTIGNATITLYRLQDSYDILAHIFTHGTDGFPPCRQCNIRPRRVRQTVLSDWDAEQQCLLLDSMAHSY